MNPKISRLRAEREKNNGKIAALQTRNREIDSQIMELENTDIIGMVRESGFTPEQLARLLQSMRQGQFPAPEAERRAARHKSDKKGFAHDVPSSRRSVQKRHAPRHASW